MPLIVSDTFTEASDTNLTAHVPDVGTGWTEEVRDTASVIGIIDATLDVASATGLETSKKLAYSAQPNPTVNQYDVQATLKNYSSTAPRCTFLFGRFTSDAEAGYAFLRMASGDANDHRLIKRTGSTNTELAVTDGGSVNDIYKLEIRSAAKKVYQNGGEILSSADDTITANGKAGLGFGNLYSAGDTTTSTDWDDFTVTTQEDTAAYIQPMRIY